MEGSTIKLQRNCVVIVVAVLLWSLSVQTSTAYWFTKTFDISNSEWPAKIITTSDGGFAIAGSVDIRERDFLLIKTDQYGRMNWIHTYGTDDREYGYGLTECAVGGFVLVGQILHDKAWIVRTDSYGAPLWNLTIFEEDTSTAKLLDVIELPSGDLLAAGYIRSQLLNYTNAWLVNIDANGTLKWSKTFANSSQHQLFESIILCQNGDLLMAGDTANPSDNLQNLLMIRTTSSGDLIFSKTFNFVGNEDFWSAIETYDGGFVLTGSRDREWGGGHESRMLLLRTDSSGNFMWNKTYSGSEVHIGPNGFRMAEVTAGRDVVECDDNGFAITGATNSFANYFPNNIWLVRTDENGNPTWNFTIKRDSQDSPVSMAKRSDGGFAIVASSDSDILLAVLDDKAPYTPSTTTTTQDPQEISLQTAAVIVGVGASPVLAVILYYRYKRSAMST